MYSVFIVYQNLIDFKYRFYSCKTIPALHITDNGLKYLFNFENVKMINVPASVRRNYISNIL